MILVDEGKLALNDPAIQYLPELAQLRVIAEQDDQHTLLVPPNKPITIEHLLTPFQRHDLGSAAATKIRN
jgi:CubicO group peptidase (beta-lactamase class C family)